MRILHVVYSMSLKTGGLAVAVNGMSKALARKGHSVSVYTTDELEDEKGKKIEELNGYKIYRFPSSNFFISSYSPQLKNQLLDEISNFDVIHIHGLWVYTTYICAKICRRLNRPYIITPHGMLDQWSFHQGYVKKIIYAAIIEKENINKAKVVHFTTEKEKTRSSHFGIKAFQAVAPLGIDLKEFIPDEKQQGIKSIAPELYGSRFVLFFSRIHPKKGLELLIKAFSKLSVEFNDLRLVIMGSGEAGYINNIKHQLKKYGIFDKTYILGAINGKKRFEIVKNAEFVCLPSKQENFGLALVESLACKTPVIVSSHVDLSDDIKKNGAGLIVDYNVDSIYNSCKEFLLNRKLRDDMAENGRKWVTANYEWANTIERLERLYEKCMQ